MLNERDFSTQASMTRARIWARVSTGHQDESQQLEACRRRIAYGDHGTPWAFDEASGIYRARDVSRDDEDAPERLQVFGDARAGGFDVLVVWALDRFTGAGILALLLDVQRLKKAGVRLVSVQEDWAENELLMSIAAWQAQQELLRKRQRSRMAVDNLRRQLAERGEFWSRGGKKITKLGRPAKVDRAAALALWNSCASCGFEEHAHPAPGCDAFKRQAIGAVARAAKCSRTYFRDHILKGVSNEQAT